MGCRANGTEKFHPIIDQPVGPKDITVREDDKETGVHPVSNGVDRFIYVWKASAKSECTPPTGKHTIMIKAVDLKGSPTEVSKEIEVLPSGDDPGCDHPDDNYSVSTIDYESFAVPDDADDFSLTVKEPVPMVSVLERGKSGITELLLDNLKEEYELRPVDFSPSIVSETPLLIIPSGGLYSLENSEFFKTALVEYVNNGGAILVFAQQHGYEYSVLPNKSTK
ncbi:MAG: hypothetical protein AB1610_09950 [Nitrospirota bacterium]